MPKRTNEDKLQHYRRKIRKLKQRKYNRIVYSSSSDSDSG